MKPARETPSFRGRRPATLAAHRAAQGSSKKTNTRCEQVLRQALWLKGLRYRISPPELAGRPDIVFIRQRVVVFCDGDFWHGRHLESRLARLSRGHNAPYWVEKIRTNAKRDQAITRRLRKEGWQVVRVWETDILHDSSRAVAKVAKALRAAGRTPPPSRTNKTLA
jgi:DNA mismatch endonuclease (patch repair protein)